jgi:hypothetical protein
MDKCEAGGHMNWEIFLVNQFLTEYKEAHEKGIEFDYAWLLILITLVAWRDSKET